MSIEQTQENKHPYLPSDALSLLEPLSELDQLRSFDSQEQHDFFMLNANVRDIAERLSGFGAVERELADGSVVTLQQHEEGATITNLSVRDMNGMTSFKHFMNKPEVYFRQVGEEERPIPFALVPTSHWSGLALTKKGLEEGRKRGGSDNSHETNTKNRRRRQRVAKEVAQTLPSGVRISHVS